MLCMSRDCCCERQLMARKFKIGEKVRVAPVLPGFYPPSIRPGRIITVAQIRPATHGKHCFYLSSNRNRRGLGPYWYRGDHLRPLTDTRSLRGGRRAGAGRRRCQPQEA